MKKFSFLFLIFSPLLAQAQEGGFDICSKTKFLKDLPVLESGRVKPLGLAAQTSLKFLAGKKFSDVDLSVKAFCQLSLYSVLAVDKPDLSFLVEHAKVKKILGLRPEQTTAKVDEVTAKKDLLVATLRESEEFSGQAKALQSTLQRLQLYEAMTEGKLWTVFNAQNSWEPLTDSIKATGEDIEKILRASEARYNLTEESYRYRFEKAYLKANIFKWVMVVVLLAIFALVIGNQRRWPGFTLAWSAFLLQVAGIAWRILISGRAPITNMYETVMFSGTGALAVALILSYFKRDSIFVIAGLSYNFLCLMMMSFSGGMLDPKISPLVPVLRDNFWLSTHVTTVILSYAALALSWMLANILIIKSLWKKPSAALLKKSEKLIYSCQKVGVVLLATGIILGGLWADYSWGRFWGWDPKETWSLIALLIYLAILHGRYAGWIKPKTYFPLTAMAFLSIMMAWFGVNYILAAGLHTYGFSSGGAFFLGAFFFIQTALVGFSWWKKSLFL